MFSHLHVHTENTLLNSTIRVDKMIEKAIDLGQKAIAITDNGNLFGLIDFYKEAEKKPIIPIIGLEINIVKSLDDKSKYHTCLVLLAKNDIGRQNLFHLSSFGYLKGHYYKPRVDLKTLEKYSSGLIMLSGGVSGNIRNYIKNNDFEQAQKSIIDYKQIFKDDFYLEIINHFRAEDKSINEKLFEYSKKFDIKCVLTNDACFLDYSDYEAFGLFLKIQKTYAKSDQQNQEQFLKSSQDMANLYPDKPEIIDNIEEIIDKCKDYRFKKPGPKFPVFEIPPKPVDEKRHTYLKSIFKDRIPDTFETKNDFLQYITYDGLDVRFPQCNDKVYLDRVELELNIIFNMNFSEYFLIVWDFIKYAKDNDIPVGPGRGSGAGSLVTFCLKITDVNPVQYNLLFERFLNPERVSLPDLDIDICYEGREDVIKYVTQKYGQEKVAQIITFGTLKAKAVIKDIARVVGASFEDANNLSKMIRKEDKNLQFALENNKELQIAYENGFYRQIIDSSLKLEELKRHASVHAAGVVIGQDEIVKFVPLYKEYDKDMPVTQYTGGDLESCGLVKMDFLGLKTLTIVKKTIKSIVKNNPQKNAMEFDINSIDLYDKKVFAMLSEGKSDMVFQFESDGMKKILSRVKPTKMEDLTALNALYRPGPLQFIDTYANRKNGLEKVDYIDKSIEKYIRPILEETYGIMVYQEQVMAMFQVLGGFSLGGADLVRRAMSKKKKEVLEEQKVLFLKGGKNLGFEESVLEKVYQAIIPFTEYGFNKSHSLAYSLLAYQTAYLKCHYPVEFYCANLNNEIKNSETFVSYLILTRKDNVSIKKPCINTVPDYFIAKNNAIEYGLAGIENIGPAVYEEIIKKRKEGGDFKSIKDFLVRVDTKVINVKALDALIKSGLFDNLNPNTKAMVENMDTLIRESKNTQDLKKEQEKQSSLMDLMELPQNEDDGILNDTEDYSLEEKLLFQLHYLGICFVDKSIINRLSDENIKLSLSHEKGDKKKTGFIESILMEFNKVKHKIEANFSLNTGQEIIAFNIYFEQNSDFENILKSCAFISITYFLNKSGNIVLKNIEHFDISKFSESKKIQNENIKDKNSQTPVSKTLVELKIKDYFLKDLNKEKAQELLGKIKNIVDLNKGNIQIAVCYQIKNKKEYIKTNSFVNINAISAMKNIAEIDVD